LDGGGFLFCQESDWES